MPHSHSKSFLSSAKKMESILDFDKELDLAFLDKVVTSFYHGSGPDVRSLAEGKPRRNFLAADS